MAKRVLLLGAGPAHLRLLQALARQPLAGAEVALVTPFARQLHAPMVAGVVAGRSRADDCTIALLPLAAAARVHFIEATVVALDAATRCAQLSDGRVVDYELLSLDSEPAMDRSRIPGARQWGLFLRPTEHFVRLLDGLWDLAARRVLDVVVVGGGDAQAVELALALSQRLTRSGEQRARVALVTGGGEPLMGCSAAVARRALHALARERVTVFRDSCRALEPGAAVLTSGARLACDAAVLATAAEPPAWLQGSGLALDEQAWVATGDTLQSRSHPEVLAVRPAASGAGSVLTLNLRGLVGGEPLRPFSTPAPVPMCIDLGKGGALWAWGRWSAQGLWGGWLKQRADQRFLAQCRVVDPAPFSRSA
jgi:NADH dehydrogenase FAD-containing subunit